MNTNNLRKLALETNDGLIRGPALVAASEIDRLRSENERLTKERDEARAEQAVLLERAAGRMDAGFSYNAGNCVRGVIPDDASAADMENEGGE